MRSLSLSLLSSKKIDFGGGPFTATMNSDGFAAKLDAAGNHVWSRAFGNGLPQEFRPIAVDGTGDTLLTGDFHGTIDTGAGSLTSAGTFDVLFASYGSSGTGKKALRFGDSDGQYGIRIVADPLGAPIIAGTFGGTLDFGAGGSITSSSSWNVFVAKLAP